MDKDVPPLLRGAGAGLRRLLPGSQDQHDHRAGCPLLHRQVPPLRRLRVPSGLQPGGARRADVGTLPGLRVVTRFELGRVVATPGALEALEETGTDALDLLQRHQSGDWGDVPPADARENQRSLKHGLRVLSSYPVGGGKVWVITEADRSSTCVLLPSEY